MVYVTYYVSCTMQFYGVMTGVYAIFTVAWLIVLGLNYTDLVRLQFWVLAVILLGFVEKAFFLAEFDSVNQGKECESQYYSYPHSKISI